MINLTRNSLSQMPDVLLNLTMDRMLHGVKPCHMNKHGRVFVLLATSISDSARQEKGINCLRERGRQNVLSFIKWLVAALVLLWHPSTMTVFRCVIGDVSYKWQPCITGRLETEDHCWTDVVGGRRKVDNER